MPKYTLKKLREYKLGGGDRHINLKLMKNQGKNVEGIQSEKPYYIQMIKNNI